MKVWEAAGGYAVTVPVFSRRPWSDPRDGKPSRSLETGRRYCGSLRRHCPWRRLSQPIFSPIANKMKFKLKEEAVFAHDGDLWGLSDWLKAKPQAVTGKLEKLHSLARTHQGRQE